MINALLSVLALIGVSVFLIIARWLYYRHLTVVSDAGRQRATTKTDILIVVAIIATTAIVLLVMGLTPWYKYGPIRLWSGDIKSNQNSQQVADPYTFTHIIHGVGFYALLRLVPAPLSLGTRAILAVTAESAWEVFENTDMVINRYRTATLSLDYYGDSVVNSVADIITSMIGFFFAARFSTRVSIILIILIEVILAFTIRDNLFFNIFLLIYPVPAIKNWQLGG